MIVYLHSLILPKAIVQCHIIAVGSTPARKVMGKIVLEFRPLHVEGQKSQLNEYARLFWTSEIQDRLKTGFEI